MSQPERVLSTSATVREIAGRVRDLGSGIRRLTPSNHNPDSFHEMKSDLVAQARFLADQLEAAVR